MPAGYGGLDNARINRPFFLVLHEVTHLLLDDGVYQAALRSHLFKLIPWHEMHRKELSEALVFLPDDLAVAAMKANINKCPVMGDAVSQREMPPQLQELQAWPQEEEKEEEEAAQEPLMAPPRGHD